MSKKWTVNRGISEEFKGRFSEVDPVVLQLLVNRNIVSDADNQARVQQKMTDWLEPKWSEHIHDPFLFRDMAKAVERIFQAVESNERIAVYGDYDADGICGSVILYSVLQRLGAKNLTVYIPHREHEGYGLNEGAVRQLVDEGVKLIISVDLGIANADEVAVASELGADVIVVDHHDLVDRGGGAKPPPAYAIIHADLPGETYPFKDLCGTGTAFKLAQALLNHSMEETEGFEKWLLDLAVIGTIGDMVPLRGENRVITKYGLMVLNKTQRVGLKALIEMAGINGRGPSTSSGRQSKIDAWKVAWQIVPRLNAAGRIYHAREALMLLLEESEAKAQELAKHLNKINTERQRLADKVHEEAIEQFELSSPLTKGGIKGGFEVETPPPDPLLGKEGERYLLVGFKPDWPLGVVGLVAGRLADKYHRPVILLTETGGIVKGSGRSIPEFDITQSLAKVSEHLLKFGGHPGACGLSLELDKREQFSAAFADVAREKLAGRDLRPALKIDLELGFVGVNSELVEQLEKFEPFGQGNPQPLLMSRKLVVKEINTVGANKQHLKLTVSDEQGKSTHKVIGFGFSANWLDKLKIGDKIDIVYELGFNEWNGNRELQLKLRDMSHSFK